MLLRRDLLIAVLTLGLAAAIYAFSFRDLATADPVLSGIEPGIASQISAKVPATVPEFAG